ncbi:hypothetical protein PVT68_14760 [Microbulbifer bruguierae]|uniref:Uncharacterized protein n=1 Tax=Microbulbifer bruguierae TaxID=3029061 RepID=A0ABY8NC70_9GAMM|nr:hypothetical protein [Microbulbifer bruguierae]WGL16024.1 hypothetical protein PVT68_14760 [Microbulbifer bruguierae]
MLAVLILWGISLISTGLAMDELKKNQPKEYVFLGGEKSLFWPPAILDVVGYFLAFEYRHIWGFLRKRKLFLLASLCNWLAVGYFVAYLLGRF